MLSPDTHDNIVKTKIDRQIGHWKDTQTKFGIKVQQEKPIN